MKKKHQKKMRCPKCDEAFFDTDEATRHAKENKHWGDYNIYYDIDDEEIPPPRLLRMGKRSI